MKKKLFGAKSSLSPEERLAELNEWPTQSLAPSDMVCDPHDQLQNPVSEETSSASAASKVSSRPSRFKKSSGLESLNQKNAVQSDLQKTQKDWLSVGMEQDDEALDAQVFALNSMELPPKSSEAVAEVASVDWKAYWEEKGFLKAWPIALVGPFQNHEEWHEALCRRCSHQDPYLKSTALIHIKEGHYHCFRCGAHGDISLSPAHYRGQHGRFEGGAWVVSKNAEDIWQELKKFDADLALEEVEQWVHQESMALSQTWLDRNGHSGWKPALGFECRAESGGVLEDVLFVSLKDAASEEVFFQDIPGALSMPWGWDQLNEEMAQELIIVDDPLDRLALISAGFKNVIVLPPRMNTVRSDGGDFSVLQRMEKRLDKCNRLVLALKNHENSHRLEEELARRLGRERCFRVRWSVVGHGAWEVKKESGVGLLQEAIANASAYPVQGIYELYDVEDRFDELYEFGLLPGVSVGLPSLDPYYTVKPGQWTAVLGIPGHGKSTFLDDIMVNMAKEHGWVFGVFSPENQPIERHYINLIEKAAEAPFNEGEHMRMNKEQKEHWKPWVNKHFKMILPSEENGNWTLDGVLSLAKTMVYRYGIRGLVIDPWNELDHSNSGQINDNEYFSQSLSKIRRFARLFDVHVWVVTHPKLLALKQDGLYPVPTPYDANGGALWRNKADAFLTVFRFVGKSDETITDIHVQKIRWREIGRVGRVSFRFDPVCGKFWDDVDQMKRTESLKAGTHLKPSEYLLDSAPKNKQGGVQNIPVSFEGDGLPSIF